MQDDLGVAGDVGGGAPERWMRAHPVLEAFVTKRSQAPEGTDHISGLAVSQPAFSLHAGAWRGLTWFDTDEGVVWLLAARFHRSGKRDDAYPYFRSLGRDELLPTPHDYESFFTEQELDFAAALLDEPRALLALAQQHPGDVVAERIARRIDVRLCVEDDDTPPRLVTVAVDQRLRPGDLAIPDDWLIQLAAAFLPRATFEDLALADEIGGQPLRPSEIAFCEFLDE